MHKLGTFAVALVITVASHFAPATVQAQDRRYWVEAFDADIRILESGEIEVAERLTFRFEGSFNGVYRDIPIKYETPWGLDYGLRLDPVAVTAEDGSSLRHEADRRGDDFRFKVWVPDANNASRTVVLRYRVGRALRFPDTEEGFEAHDQLYWNVTVTCPKCLGHFVTHGIGADKRLLEPAKRSAAGCNNVASGAGG